MGEERRRQVVVDKSLQNRIIFATACVPLVCLAGPTLLLAIFCVQLNDAAIQVDVELPSILPVYLAATCCMLVATGYMLMNALKFSHRIAGPSYNVRKTLERFREGDRDVRIVLREHDHLVEIQDHINDFLEWLEEDLLADRTSAGREPGAESGSDAEAEKAGTAGSRP